MDPLTQPISEFSIIGLHGERNIRIPFDGPVKIIVAENGYGKTTVLNSLYALLYGNYEKLRTLQFIKLQLNFKSGKSITLEKTDFTINIRQTTGMVQHFKTFLSVESLHELYSDFSFLPRDKLKTSRHFSNGYRDAQKRFNNLSIENFIQWLEVLSNEFKDTDLFSQNIRDARAIIAEEFPLDAIYLPTYRRIEEDLRNLMGMPIGLDIEKNVIQFGMTDVQASFDQITDEITNSSIQWFAKINGQMLGQLIGGISLTEDMRQSLNDQEALKIVLERVGDNIRFEDKEKILRMIENKEILSKLPLAYFLANLVKVYEQQKENDNAIKRFTEKCNKYLAGKYVSYNESAVKISIRRQKNDDIVDITTLSSGEKQIISLFSRLFLTKLKRVAIFFDEPELSLSINWQKSLLPDILDSGKCGFLFSTTHSPFIFENELVQFTSGLDKFIEEL